MDLWSIKTDGSFFEFWFLQTLIPVFSGIYLTFYWIPVNIAIIGAMWLDFVLLLGADASDEFSVNWYRVVFIGLS